MEIKEILRNNRGLIGETTRTLTEYYFNFIYNSNDLKASCRDLLEYRNGFYEFTPQVNGLTKDEITLLTNSFFDNIPALMLIFFYIECYIDEDFQKVIDSNLVLAYIVAIEEHKRISDLKKHKPIVKDLNDDETLVLQQIIGNRY